MDKDFFKDFFEKEIERLTKTKKEYENLAHSITITIFLISGFLLRNYIFKFIDFTKKYMNFIDLYSENSFIGCSIFIIWVIVIVIILLFIFLLYDLILKLVYGFLKSKKGDFIIVEDSYTTKNPLLYFEVNFYPKGYYRIFKRVFDKNFSNENDKFTTWINSQKMSAKELYIKLLQNEKIQDEIRREIMTWQNDLREKLMKEQKEKAEKELQRLKKEALEEIKITGEIEEFFMKINN